MIRSPGDGAVNHSPHPWVDPKASRNFREPKQSEKQSGPEIYEGEEEDQGKGKECMPR